jgi:hypothetical protein
MLRLRHGGTGPPLLLLHGNPQTHAMWNAVAPALADRFTIVFICAVTAPPTSRTPAPIMHPTGVVTLTMPPMRSADTGTAAPLLLPTS